MATTTNLLATLVIVTVTSGCASSGGERQPPPAESPAAQQVTQWLDLQRSGEQAGSTPYTGGDEMTRTYDRYLDSFIHPIPDEFSFDD
ncbi:MAG: DUF3613 domain-containing protein [Halomonadaceae bacterium]|nr:MAG: DUF3613 domain-containing protein [Halomonadaceae bacterium]